MRNPFRPRLSPITRKRLQRFRSMKRAYWSFCALVLLYAVSLCSELICNDRPLFLRFAGKSYFPAFRYYPQSTFIKGGPPTRCDYKELLSRPEFRDDEENYMLWAPVSHGPNEVVPTERVRIPVRVELNLRPRVAAAEVRVDPDFRIVRGGYGAGPLLGVAEEEILGQKLGDVFRLPAGLCRAAEARFAGGTATSASWQCLRQAGLEGAPVHLQLSAFSKTSAQPRRLIKVTLRELSSGKKERIRFDFDEEKRVVEGDAARWAAIPKEPRAQLDEALDTALGEESVEPFLVELGEGASYEARFEREVVRYPFRPVKGHLLGMDDTGRDVFARLLYGLRTSMTFGLILVVCSLVFGTIFGAIQGYLGGLIDLGGQRFTEIWSALPFLYIMILLGNVYGRSFGLLIFCYALFNWIGMSYYMRAEMLRLRKQPFTEAARCLGLPAHRIMFRHILPNALTPLITLFPFSLVGAIGSLAALDYLGFGLPPPTPSWGELLSQAQTYRWAWWLILYPALALFTVMLLGVFVGEGVRSAFDPKRHSRMQ
jgi:microcin C transport system permease protein